MVLEGGIAEGGSTFHSLHFGGSMTAACVCSMRLMSTYREGVNRRILTEEGRRRQVLSRFGR